MATKTGMQYFRTTEQMSKEIKECADAYDVTQTELVRMAVTYFIRTLPIITMAPEQTQKKQEPSP